jgi:hypothetical protein
MVMDRTKRTMRTIRVAAVLAVATVLGCNALLGIEEGTPRATDAGACVLNSDCPDPHQVCLFQVCSPPCVADKDCPGGARCLATESGTACVVSAAAACAGTDGCPAGTTCSANECRNPCGSAGKACLPDQTCTASVCVGNDHGHDPIRDAGADARSDAKPADAAPDHATPGDGGVCTPSAKPTKCGAKETPQLCNASGQWEDVATGACSGATPVCLNGACVACAPNASPTQCSSNNTPQFCNPSGQWESVPSGACSGATPACLNGVCGTCTPSATPTQCSNNTPQFCTTGGTWQPVPTGACAGANGTCLNGSCVACAPNPSPTQCANNTPQFCNASGSWQNAAACSGATSVCLSGGCVACSPDPAPTQCSNNAPQFCNANGSWQSNAVCGSGLACKSGQCACTPAATSCSGSTLLTCSNDGTSVTSTPCASGCVLGPARCQKVVPSNGLGVDYYQAPLDWTATAGTTINTGSDATPPTITPSVGALITVVTQSGNPDIAVFKFHSITIPAGVTVRVTGGRALALLSATDVSIQGTLDVSSNYDFDCGPASNTGCTAAAGKSASTTGTDPSKQWGCGGSGGGYATPGGSGGWYNSQNCHGALTDASMVCNNPALSPLYGGNGGGWAYRPPAGISLLGGCGGGAVQVVAAKSLTVGGVITASGGGGGYQGRFLNGVTSRSSDNVGGAGGGSGGAILLESPSVSLPGKLFVNGGGGGPGSISQAGVQFIPGPNGGQYTTAEPLTSGASAGVGPGGGGASGSSIAAGGTSENSAPGGGGGGGAGRIRVNDTSGLVCQMSGPFYPTIVGVTSCSTVTVQ